MINVFEIREQLLERAAELEAEAAQLRKSADALLPRSKEKPVLTESELVTLTGSFTVVPDSDPRKPDPPAPHPSPQEVAELPHQEPPGGGERVKTPAPEEMS